MGANINTEDIKGKDSQIPPSSNCELIKYLIDKGININMVDGQGNTMLMQAIIMNHKETIYFLLNRQDVNIRIKNHYNDDALSLAIDFCSDDIISTIIRRGGYTKEEVIVKYELGNGHGDTSSNPGRD